MLQIQHPSPSPYRQQHNTTTQYKSRKHTQMAKATKEWPKFVQRNWCHLLRSSCYVVRRDPIWALSMPARWPIKQLASCGFRSSRWADRNLPLWPPLPSSSDVDCCRLFRGLFFEDGCCILKWNGIHLTWYLSCWLDVCVEKVAFWKTNWRNFSYFFNNFFSDRSHIGILINWDLICLQDYVIKQL